MWFTLVMNENFTLGMMILTSLASFGNCLHMSPMSCNGSLSVSCPALLYYVPQTPKNIEEMMALFQVSSNLVNRTANGYVVEGVCHCLADDEEFNWDVNYMVQHGDTWESISSNFGSFVMKKPDKTLIAATNITLEIICGCSEKLELLSYKVERGDTLFTICSQFRCVVDKVAKLNNVDNPMLIFAGDVMFIPVSASQKNLILPVDGDTKAKKDSGLKIYIMVGIVLGAVFILSLGTFFFWRHCYRRQGTRKKARARGIRPFPCDFNAFASYSEDSVAVSIFSDQETDFSYNELRDATYNFSSSRMIGKGSYGSVYLGKLRGTDVAVKQMKDANSKEFFSELNILCKVHHKNLIKLIGHAAGGDSISCI